MPKNPKKELRQFVASSLGAKEAFGERLAIYIPNKGRSGSEPNPNEQVTISDWKGWVTKLLYMLGNINRGATALPASEGFYLDDHDIEVWEQTTIVYSFVWDRDEFRKSLANIRHIIHEFGRETRQETVFVEFDGFAYAIKEPFDDDQESA